MTSIPPAVAPARVGRPPGTTPGLHGNPIASVLIINDDREAMADLRLRQSWLVYPGAEQYSLGNGVTALPRARVRRVFGRG